jgi:hypothetical protein
MEKRESREWRRECLMDYRHLWNSHSCLFCHTATWPVYQKSYLIVRRHSHCLTDSQRLRTGRACTCAPLPLCCIPSVQHSHMYPLWFPEESSYVSRHRQHSWVGIQFITFLWLFPASLDPRVLHSNCYGFSSFLNFPFWTSLLDQLTNSHCQVIADFSNNDWAMNTMESSESPWYHCKLLLNLHSSA